MPEHRWLTFDLFEGRVGEEFAVSADGVDAVAMELAEATESAEPGGTGPGGETRLQFSLLFRGPSEPLLPQATYVVEHDDLGRLEVFLVPVGPHGGGMGYQAVFA